MKYSIKLIGAIAVLGISLATIQSCEEIILEDNISSAIVEVLAPADNSVLNITNVTFTWEPIEYADAYHLQVAVPNFATALQIVEDTLISQTNFSKTLVPEQYEWRVKALNSAYETIYTIQSFRIEE